MGKIEKIEVQYRNTYETLDLPSSIDDFIDRIKDIKHIIKTENPDCTKIEAKRSDYNCIEFALYRLENAEEYNKRLQKIEKQQKIRQKAKEKDLEKKRKQYETLKKLFEKEPN